MSSSDRVLSILSLFTPKTSEWTVDQAAATLKTSLSTTYRDFASLARTGFISSLGAGRYILGPGAIQLDWIIRQTDPLLAVAKPAMKILAGALTDPAVLLLCRLYREQVMCVAQETAGHPSFASGYQRGRPMPLFRGAASKAILAHMPDRTVKAIVRRQLDDVAAAGLGNDWPEIRRTLRAIRHQGYSITRGEIDPGLTGIAVAIPGPDAYPAGCIAFVVKEDYATPAATAPLVRLLQSGAAQISAEHNEVTALV